MSGAANLASLRDVIVAALRVAVPGVSIEPHGGMFTASDIAMFMTRTPAIRVAIMGCGQAYRNNLGIVLPVNVSCVVVTRDQLNPQGGSLRRDVQALLIANALTLAVMSNRWGLDGVYQPEDLKSVNQYSADFFEKGLTLYEVSWTQGVTLGLDAPAAIAALAKLYINEVLFADPAPIAGVDPLVDPKNYPGAA